MRDAARVLRDRKSEERYAALAGRLASWIEYEYFSASGRCVVNTQTAYTLAIVSGFGNMEFSARALAQLLARNDGKLTTGFVGTAFLNRALSETGLTREAFDLLLNEDYPSWLHCVKLGATTIWERWNSLDETGHITSIDMNSMNHYSYGAIVEWLYAYVAGLRYVREEPGFRRAVVAPTPNWRLGSISCDYRASVGTWHVGWCCVDETHLHVELTVPLGCTAEVMLPLADEYAYEELGGHVLAAGTYELTYETSEPLRRMPTVDWPLAQLMEQPDTAAVVSRYCYHPEFLLGDPERSAKSVRELAPTFARGGGPMSEEALEACETCLRVLWE